MLKKSIICKKKSKYNQNKSIRKIEKKVKTKNCALKIQSIN